MAWHYGFTAFRELANRGDIRPGDFVKVDGKTYYLTILYRGGQPKYELNDTSLVLNARKALRAKDWRLIQEPNYALPLADQRV